MTELNECIFEFEPYLDHETKYLNFYHIEMSKSGKTKIISVTTKGNIPLGTIKFYGRWRGYQYFPITKDQIILSIGCMTYIIEYIKSLKTTVHSKGISDE